MSYRKIKNISIIFMILTLISYLVCVYMLNITRESLYDHEFEFGMINENYAKYLQVVKLINICISTMIIITTAIICIYHIIIRKFMINYQKIMMIHVIDGFAVTGSLVLLLIVIFVDFNSWFMINYFPYLCSLLLIPFIALSGIIEREAVSKNI